MRTKAIAATLVFLGSSVAWAAQDRLPPTKPTNLRVTATTSYNVSLAWNPSNDNSGKLSYRVVVSTGATYTVPQAQTTFSHFVAPTGTYSFYVYAVDGAGNKSQKSNTVSATPPPDTIAPSAPVVTNTGINSREIALEWPASTDDGPYLFYQVFVNGVANVDARQSRLAVVQGLNPETTYDVTVKARDLYGPPNVSGPSNIVRVTTPAAGGADAGPPSSPAGLHGWDAGDGAREINLFWTRSFDDVTLQGAIVYEVYQNGVLDHMVAGADRTILYANQPGENVFTIIAVDEAGNESVPASVEIVSQ